MSRASRPRDDGEPGEILFVTCRKVKEGLDTKTPQDISKSLSNRLTEDAINSFKEGRSEDTNNIRVGWAENASKTKSATDSTKWTCKIFEDQPIGNRSEDSAEAFALVADNARRLTKPVLLYVHGYNNTITTALQSAARIRSKYGCEVIPFLWPTEGRIKDYDEDRQDAEMSAQPLLRFFAKAMQYLDEAGNRQPVVLMCHSMGNYVLQCAVETEVTRNNGVPDLENGKKSLGANDSSLFHDIILTAADVDSKDHIEWVRDLRPKGKVFIFINTDDDVLRLSDHYAGRFFLAKSIGDILFGRTDHPPRLGQTLKDIEPTRDRIYIDVNVTPKHPLDIFQFLQMEHWYHKNGQGEIEKFYKDVIHGSWSDRSYRDKKHTRGGTTLLVDIQAVSDDYKLSTFE